MLPKKGLRKITIKGIAYGWRVSRNSNPIKLYIEKLNEGGQLLTAQFDSHFKEFIKQDHTGKRKKWNFYQQLIVTPKMVKQVIEIGFEKGWNVNQSSGTLNLGFVDEFVDLDIKKAVKLHSPLTPIDFDNYPWSAITLKCVELLQLEINIEKTLDNLIRIQDRVEDYNLQSVTEGIVIKLLDILLSKEEHTEAVLIPNEERAIFHDFDSLMESLNTDYKNDWYSHGEWSMWRLPTLGYGLYIQYEANPAYFWTDTQLLNTSIQEQIDKYSF